MASNRKANRHYKSAAMSSEELRVVVVVYLAAIAPLVVLLAGRKHLPNWVPMIYVGSVLGCAVGWELWFNYGWLDGEPVDARRAMALNIWLPKSINWLMNSLADGGAICLGGLWLMWLATGKDSAVFKSWHWGAFGVLLVWCVGQNLVVELFLYHDQLANGKVLSWAPLAPSGPYFNPTLFELNERGVRLQTQIPWLVFPFLLYQAVILTTRKMTVKPVPTLD